MNLENTPGERDRHKATYFMVPLTENVHQRKTYGDRIVAARNRDVGGKREGTTINGCRHSFRGWWKCYGKAWMKRNELYTLEWLKQSYFSSEQKQTMQFKSASLKSHFTSYCFEILIKNNKINIVLLYQSSRIKVLQAKYGSRKAFTTISTVCKIKM